MRRGASNEQNKERRCPRDSPIPRQLGIVVAQLRRLLGDHLELVRNLGELAARRRQVRRGRAQITLQLRQPRPKCCLLASSVLSGISGSGLSDGCSGLGPLGGLLSRRRGSSELLDLGLGECRMDLPGPTTSVGTRTDYSVGPWDYLACATRHLKAWSTRTTEE
jgi:hypothetical protein